MGIKGTKMVGVSQRCKAEPYQQQKKNDPIRKGWRDKIIKKEEEQDETRKEGI